MRRAPLVVVLFGSVACGHLQASPAPVPVAAADHAVYDDHPPGSRQCPWVADGCVPDGCPEADGRGPPATRDPSPTIDAACHQAAPDKETLADVARELRDKQALTRLRIVAPNADCATAVRVELERDSVARGRIATVSRPTRYAYFEVAMWNGVRCE